MPPFPPMDGDACSIPFEGLNAGENLSHDGSKGMWVLQNCVGSP